MTLSVQHVRLGNVDDYHGVLLFDGDVLVAVLAQLSLEHGERVGHWFLEHGFGAGLETDTPFEDLKSACTWIEDRIERRDREAAAALLHPTGRDP
jgi:hypothetical protein